MKQPVPVITALSLGVVAAGPAFAVTATKIETTITQSEVEAAQAAARPTQNKKKCSHAA